MMDGLKPYPVYKDSGVEWLGKVPEHWEVDKLRQLTEFRNGFPFKPPDWSGSGTPIIRIQNLNGSDHFNYTSREDIPAPLRVRPGDLLFSWSGNRGTSFGPFLWRRQFAGYLNQHIFKLEGYRLNRDFFAYVLQAVTKHIEEQTHGIIGLVHITKPELGAIRVPVAPDSEQDIIGRFLDHAARRIRHFIRAKQKLIKLLEEKKQAIIHRAVTRGLDSNICLRPSGVEWLGDVPEHWEVRRNGRLFAQRQEIGFPDLPILEVSLRTGVRVQTFDASDRKQVMLDRSQYKRALRGDIAYNMMRMWQGAVGVAPVDGLVSPAYVVARPLEGTETRYFHRLFRTAEYMSEIDAFSRGIVKDRNRLYWEDFKQMPSPCPPPEEQAQIADAVDEEARVTEGTISTIQNEIALLREYRTRLISDVVTGKLDVREAAVKLPAEPTDPEESIDEIADTEAVDLEAAVEEEVET